LVVIGTSLKVAPVSEVLGKLHRSLVNEFQLMNSPYPPFGTSDLYQHDTRLTCQTGCKSPSNLIRTLGLMVDLPTWRRRYDRHLPLSTIRMDDTAPSPD
jgi:hypothetical protein